MIVRVFLASGDERVITADGARLDGELFLITRWLQALRRDETLVTLWADTVVKAQVEDGGIVLEYVPGPEKQQVTRE
jgi:hypothetical protein